MKGENKSISGKSVVLSRRDFLKAAAVGAAGLGVSGYLIKELMKPSKAETNIPKATSKEFSANHKKAYDFVGMGGEVRCTLCPNSCILSENQRGVCRVRTNIGGVLYSLVYGNPCSRHIDPIEKKPLYHFLPGSKAYSIATAGCNLRCLNCQNWEISQRTPDETRNYEMSPEDVVDSALDSGSESIAYTYNEPSVFYEYMYDTSKLAAEKGVKNVWVTNGYINQKPLERYCDYLDAANVDLKSFDDRIYLELNGGHLKPVLDTLKTLHRRGVWFEVTNLLVPTWTDKLDMFRGMVKWMVKNIGSDHPLHVSRFFPHYKLANLPPTPIETLKKARQTALDEGLNYVYVGNAPQLKYSDTVCPSCQRKVVSRIGYEVTDYRLEDGVCSSCGQEIAGVWK